MDSITITYYITFALAGFFWWILFLYIRNLIKDIRKTKKLSIISIKDKVFCGFAIVVGIFPVAAVWLITYTAITGWLLIEVCETPLLREYKVMIKRETTCIVDVVAGSEGHAEKQALRRLKHINWRWAKEDTTAFIKH